MNGEPLSHQELLKLAQDKFKAVMPQTEVPPTVGDIIECMGNYSINQGARIRELEGHIRRLTGLNVPMRFLP